MAANLTNAYNRMAGVLAFKLAQNLPVLINTEQQVSKEVFQSGRSANGLTMNYVLPDYGTVNEGPAIQPGSMAYDAGVVPITLRQFNVPFSAGSYSNPPVATDVGGTVMTRNQLLDFDKQVKFPLGSNLASKLQKGTIEAGFKGCGTVVVLDSTRQAAGDTMWDAMSEAASAIRNARSDDEVFGAMSPRMQARAARGAANLFHPGERISKLWTKCELGEFATAKWFETADVEGFTVSSTAGSNMAGLSAVLKTGTNDTLTLSAAPGVAIKAGTPFQIGTISGGVFTNGIFEVDPLGNDTSVPFTFIVQEDVAAADTEIKVQKLYDTGALKNVTRLPDENTAEDIGAVLKDGGKYARAIVWAKPGLATAWGQMDVLEGAKNFTFGPKAGLLFYGCSFGDIMLRRNIWRLDALKGECVTMSNWVATIFYELA